ncbi:MAG: CcmD family protein [Chitinophagales bacterium]
MELIKRKLWMILACLPFLAQAQGEKSLFAQLMDTSDKMIIVVIVLLIIFFGIIFYLTLLNKKITKIEKQLEK